MLEVGSKIDNDNTSAGELTAEEFNSLMTEAENVIKPFQTLDGTKTKQMSEVIDIMTKALTYTDVGTVNAVQLTRSATTSTTETLVDGMTIIFTPANANTGATTLKITTLVAKPIFYNGVALVAGYLNTTSKFIAVYDLANDRFNIDVLTGGSAGQRQKVADAVNVDEAVSKAQLDAGLQNTGKVLQVAISSNSVAITSTANIPKDSSVPLVTEGVEILSLAFTPKSATSILYVKVHSYGNEDANNGDNLVFPLFEDSLCIGVGYKGLTGGSGSSGYNYGDTFFTVKRQKGDTTQAIYSVRAGVNSGVYEHLGTTGYTQNSDYGSLRASTIEIWEVEV